MTRRLLSRDGGGRYRTVVNRLDPARLASTLLRGASRAGARSAVADEHGPFWTRSERWTRTRSRRQRDARRGRTAACLDPTLDLHTCCACPRVFDEPTHPPPLSGLRQPATCPSDPAPTGWTRKVPADHGDRGQERTSTATSSFLPWKTRSRRGSHLLRQVVHVRDRRKRPPLNELRRKIRVDCCAVVKGR